MAGDLDLGGLNVTNPDPDRGRRPKSNPDTEVPQLNVESRQHMGSMLELDLSLLDKRFKYRWVNAAPLKVARARAKGYVFVDPDDSTIRNLVGDSPESEDGRVRVGDVILMRTPKALHKARKMEVAKRTKARLRGPKRKFKREATSAGTQRYGVPVEVITNKEPAGSRE